MYLTAFTASIVIMWVFSNKHIKNLYLLKCGTKIEVETYTNFGLTYNRSKQINIADLVGTRLAWRREWNLFALECQKTSAWRKKTSSYALFYRP